MRHALTGLLFLLLVPSVASAEAAIFTGEGCTIIPSCSATGSACAAGTHAVTLPDRGCVCAPGASVDVGLPTLCCSATTGCPLGMTCAALSDAPAGVCVGDLVTYCGDAPSAEMAVACHTTPSGMRTFYWPQGDCDLDGVPNGMEMTDPFRDPCCNDDIHCCISAGGDPIECCLALSPEPAACCLAATGDAPRCCTISDDPTACCVDSGADPVECCSAQSDYAGCCTEAAAAADVPLLACCLGDPSASPGSCCASWTDGLTGDACCDSLGGTPDECCAVGITACPEDAGATDIDGGVIPTPDGGVPGSDAGPAMDAGVTVPVDEVSFGGGGGCVCGVGRRGASPLAAAALVLLVGIPVSRRRRR